MLSLARVSALIFILGLVLSSVAAQQFHTTAEWRAKFTREADPVKKAKLLLPLGESEFKDADAALAEEKLTEALDVLQLYVAEAQESEKALDAKLGDPEKHSNGYRQLQISLRESLRRIDSMIVGLSSDDRVPFVAVRGQLDEMERHLIEKLFPKRAAGAEPPKAKK